MRCRFALTRAKSLVLSLLLGHTVHTIYIKILVGLRQSKSSTPQLIFQNSNTENICVLLIHKLWKQTLCLTCAILFAKRACVKLFAANALYKLLTYLLSCWTGLVYRVSYRVIVRPTIAHWTRDSVWRRHDRMVVYRSILYHLPRGVYTNVYMSKSVVYRSASALSEGRGWLLRRAGRLPHALPWRQEARPMRCIWLVGSYVQCTPEIFDLSPYKRPPGYCAPVRPS